MEEFKITRVEDPSYGPMDGVECRTDGVRTIFLGKGNLRKISRQEKTKVDIKASCSVGVVSISDPKRNIMYTLSISEMAAILNEALRVGMESAKGDKRRDRGR